MNDGDATDLDAIYPCVGVCWPDPERDCCMGCGRPLAGTPPAAAQPTAQPAAAAATETAAETANKLAQADAHPAA